LTARKLSTFTLIKPKALLATVKQVPARVQSLDCLRAIACLVVILSHTHKIKTPGGWSIGAYGVAFFCVLSGYLITSILLCEEESVSQVHPIRFLLRRALRILPAYFALLLPCEFLLKTGWFLKNHADYVAQTVSEFPYYATLTHNLGDGIGINHLWSISVEEQFYCFLPLLLLLTTKFRRSRQVILITTAVCLMPFALLPARDPFFCNAAFIALITGSLLAINFSRISIFLNRFGTLPIVLMALTLAAVAIIFKSCPHGPILASSYALIVWLAVSRFNNAPKLKPLAYIGQISYGVYLVQMPVCLITYWFLDRFELAHFVPLAFPINAGVSILIASASWEFFERKILNFRDRLEGSKTGLAIALLTPLLLAVGVTMHLVFPE
jgi:peptidoglycan/LPS O-acetylase OafA/YrhL